MHITTAAIPEIKIITPKKHGDARGWLAEMYNEKVWAENGITTRFVQDNHSYSAARYTLRGFHFQTVPHAQAKLVRVLRGTALDFAIDIRKGSPTFGRHVVVELRADAANMVLVPEGFAHGFLTLEPDTEIFYKMSYPYVPAADRGIVWSDPALDIKLPVTANKLTLSEKDRNLPPLKDVVP